MQTFTGMHRVLVFAPGVYFRELLESALARVGLTVLTTDTVQGTLALLASARIDAMIAHVDEELRRTLAENILASKFVPSVPIIWVGAHLPEHLQSSLPDTSRMGLGHRLVASVRRTLERTRRPRGRCRVISLDQYRERRQRAATLAE